ncbi:AraC family transcriptional regulator [Pleomorphomonas sp. NRK KF1]|uniref:helix-turn-helix domain-containing protein n=1 Tax=Pleomorphomonas sp. NRK KF1 TaxID=2943000 RepID=UPI002042E7CC|nr:AraC family transcriptional regulator [Pleomorphomonas sp. NRK KF1]MCM5555124.1 AraC family transcriptional regulator [Pleomorphomonas sp. NRK KF1]
MVFIPLPFVVAILLVVLLVAVVRRTDGEPANLPFLILVLASAVQSTLLGLRWGYGVREVTYLTPIIAASVPPLAYCGVAQLVRRSRFRLWQRIGLHALPAVGVAILLVVRRDAIDAALIAIFIGYATTILLLMRPGTDALRIAPFEGAVPAYRAIIFAAAALLLSSTIDILVIVDLALSGGRHTPQLVSVGNVVALIIIAIAGAAASRSRTPTDSAEPVPAPPPAEQDNETIARVGALMEDRHVYRDPDLNLDRLSRKAGIPVRQISSAINRATGKNVSQYVNDYRIAEACALLSETDKPVTAIMLDVGFLTKSNFNREFRRVTDTTPQAWRSKTAKPT